MKYQGINPVNKLHEGEPYFFIRAQDAHASLIVRQYAECVGVVNPKMRDECLQIANNIENWQNANPDKVKLPD